MTQPWTPPPSPPACDQDCPGAPHTIVYKYGAPTGTDSVVRHYHVTCWMCGGEVIARYPTNYHCTACDYKEGPASPSPTHKDFDEGFAAGSSSPA